MYENYEKMYPISLEDVVSYLKPLKGATPHVPVRPGFYTNLRDETLSWHLTCSISASLNPTAASVIKGPDAAKFLKKHLVNNIDKFPIGIIKHGIMCLDNGLIVTHGVLMRTEEDTYEAHWLDPYLSYKFSLERYDATIEDITLKRFLFQTQGPRSLEMLEDATGEDLHDIKFRCFRDSSIAGKKVRILRFSMSGGLGYEVHGDADDAHEVYLKILEAGIPYGLRRINRYNSYRYNHTPGGNQQLGIHFMTAAFLDEGYTRYVKLLDPARRGTAVARGMEGSLGLDPMKRYVNPIEIGLGNVVDYNHEFVGKGALLAYRENPKRNITTLRWDAEDLGEVFASQFRDEEPYFPMDTYGCEMDKFRTQDPSSFSGVSMDKVVDMSGKEIGFSSGRTTSFFHRAMLSLAVIDIDQIKLGNKVNVIWGNDGSRQKEICAEIAPFPFNTHLRNSTFDVDTIPRPPHNK